MSAAFKSHRQSLIQYLVPFKEAIFSVALLSLITNILMLTPTLYMLQLYDRVMISKNTLTLASITLVTCFFLFVMAFSEWLRTSTVIKVGVKFDQALNGKIFNLAFERALNPSTTMTQKPQQSIQDLTQLRQFFTSNGLFAFFDMPWTMIYIAVLFVMHVWLGMLAIILCCIQGLLGLWNQRSSDASLKNLGKIQLASQQFLESKSRNIEALYVMGMLPNLLHRWLQKQKNTHLLDVQAMSIQNRNQLINKFVRYSMQSLMLATAALLAIKGEISIGAMIASNVLIARALQPFDVIVSTWKQFVQAKTAAKRLNVLLKSAHKSKNVSQISQTINKPIHGEILFKNVSLTLKSNPKPILNQLDINITSGEILTIMGHSGSGKTSLARCLVGIYSTYEGDILIDEMPMSMIHPPHFAASIGYLPQDIELLEGTIAENIARFGVLEANEIIAAAKAVGIHETILRMPHGYDTKLDAAGMVLSGGQRQLIGLARALYKTPTIVVLDEPNAHLDEHGEVQLLNALSMLKNQGKTIVVISHRSTLLKITDKLLVLKNGAVLHHGAKKEVLAKLHAAKQAQVEIAA